MMLIHWKDFLLLKLQRHFCYFLGGLFDDERAQIPRVRIFVRQQRQDQREVEGRRRPPPPRSASARAGRRVRASNRFGRMEENFGAKFQFRRHQSLKNVFSFFVISAQYFFGPKILVL